MHLPERRPEEIMKCTARLTVLACGLSLVVACSDRAETQSDARPQDTVDAEVEEPEDTAPDIPRRDTTAADTDESTDTGRPDGVDGTDTETGDDGGTDFEPYFADNFEDYSDGESLSGKDPFDAAGRTTASTERAHNGSSSARMAIKEGDGGGFGQWGGIVPISPAPGVGDEIWVRLAIWWPSSFEFSASPFMKFMRLHNQEGDGSNGGYNDLYVDEANSNTSVLRTIKENHDQWEIYDGDPIPREQWETYEMYLSIDDTSVDNGGDGRLRVWRDGELIFDRTDVPTVTGPDGKIDGFFLFTYWNNEDPPNNHCFVDDLVIATSDSPPPNTDADGNRFIGDWTP